MIIMIDDDNDDDAMMMMINMMIIILTFHYVKLMLNILILHQSSYSWILHVQHEDNHSVQEEIYVTM